jgi:DNA-binding MurR/RpiR family transcriptional regulator
MNKNKEIILQNGAPVIKLISINLSRLPKLQQKIGKFIIDFAPKVIKMSISELSFAVGAKSEASIVHFYQSLGFESFSDFKIRLASEIAGKAFYHVYEDIKIDDDIETIKNKIFYGSIKILDDNIHFIDPDNLKKAIELIEKAKRIIILGFAASSAIAMYAYFNFSLIGLDCQFIADPHLSSIIISSLGKDDVIFAISYSGESKDVVIQAEHAKPLAKVIALTGFKNSPLAKVADVCIPTVGEEMNYRTDAMASRTLQLTLIDVFFTVLAIRKGSEGLDKILKARHSISYLKL